MVYLLFGMVYMLFGTLNKESILPKQRVGTRCHKVGPTFKLMILSKGWLEFHSNFPTSKLTWNHFEMKQSTSYIQAFKLSELPCQRNLWISVTV